MIDMTPNDYDMRPAWRRNIRTQRECREFYSEQRVSIGGLLLASAIGIAFWLLGALLIWQPWR